MLNKFLKFGLLTASVAFFTNVANAEDITIQPVAIESYSKEFNVSSQEAERRLKIQSQLPYIVQKLSDEFGDSIASVYFDNGQEFKLIVRTTKKGNTQKQVINLADQLSKEYSLPIEVLANSPRNFKAIQNIIENQKQRIAREYSSLQMMGYQPQKDAIKIAFYEPDVTKQNDIKNKLQKISGMDTIIEFIPKPMSEVSGAVGGGVINYQDGNGWCSGGFTGTMNGQLGILTATHCVTPLSRIISTYVNTNTANQMYYLSNGKATIPPSPYHEISFLPLKTTSVSGSVQRATSYNANSTIPTPDLIIRGVGYAQGNTIINSQNVAGTYVCHTGNTTGFSCGNVVTVSTYWGEGACNTSVLNNVDPRQVCYPTFLEVSGPFFKVARGDSGGPLFDGSGLAYGIASAIYTSNSGVFSSLAYLSNFSLKTGG